MYTVLIADDEKLARFALRNVLEEKLTEIKVIGEANSSDDIIELCEKLEPDIVFMDIETTGLSSSPLFLIGIMVWEEGGFRVHQYFARNYAEEAAVISTFLDRCLPARMLVTFNGKTYDYPYIRNRAAANGIPFNLELAHVDLLHEGRRIWKHELPNCKLQTLEASICGRHRVDDLPGSQIPDAYHAYVRTNNAYQMVGALEHNMYDLITLADIMTHFPATGMGT